MGFKRLLDEDRRLVILRSLHDVAGYEMNDSMIDTCLDAWGHRISRDEVRIHLAWLADNGFITLRELGDSQIATLTGRGEDVATGQAIVPGVKRPRAR
ncbi:VpaChn25_0724 family phage protein [Vibrio mediterranei]